MNPTEKGAFCGKCATQVVDFTNKSNEEIKSVFRSLIGQPVCGKITTGQMESLNIEFESWQMGSKRSIQSMLLFSLIVVFGLSLFSCETEHEKSTILKIQQTVGQSLNPPTDKEAFLDQLSQVEKIHPLSVNKLIESEPELLEEMDSVYHIMGEAIVSEKEVDDVDSDHHYMLGNMSMTRVYTMYLERDVPDESLTEYDENGIAIPRIFSTKAFPNPVISTTTLEIAIPQKDVFEIHLFDLSGKNIQTVFQGELNRGTHRYPVEMSELPRGVYIFTVHSGEFSESVRVVKE